MATIGNSNLTLADIAAQSHDQKLQDIVELLDADNGILADMPWVECNDGTQHKTTVRTGLPTPTWRRLYGGIQPTKSTTAQVTEATGMLEALSKADKALIDMSPEPGRARLNESRAHLEGMAQSMASTIFYGDHTANPDRFTGLAPRYNSLSAQNADNIISGGGSGSDNTSIWLVGWGENTCHGLYPRGGQAGLAHKDEGEDWVQDSSGGEYKVYRDHFKWDAGLSLKDWRYVQRIPNIDVSDLGTLANTKNLITWMIQATERMPSFGGVRPVFYVNRTIREKLRLGILEKIASNLSWETVEGKRVMLFDEIPVVRCDALLNTEAAVS